jgi:EAL domain-containing protein (putative c-di-GMP-specific phosphodiesterase class I)
LEHLHDIGIRVAIDDFGTGYSSLGRLHSLPIDKVKIDKSFVDAITGDEPAPMVAATIAMAHSLGLETVAEGVESAEQLPFLRLHGCDEVQGYLFGRPVDSTSIDALLADRGTGPLWTYISALPFSGEPVAKVRWPRQLRNIS